MNNIPRLSKNGSFVTMETVSFQIRSLENTCLILIIQIM